MNENKEELIKIWIGHKSEKIYNKFKTGGVNIEAFLIPNLLYLTRKMYVETFISIFITMFLMIVITSFFQGKEWIAFIILHLIQGFTFYKLYKWSIERKIKRNERKGLSFEQQKELAQKKGGDKVTFTVIICFIVAIIEISWFTNNFGFFVNILSKGITSFDTTYEWNIENCKFVYDPKIWTEIEYKNYKVLQYLNKDKYIIYLSTEENKYGALLFELVNDEKIKEEFEKICKQYTEESNVKVKDIDFKKINSELYLINANCDEEYNIINYYTFITIDSCVTFMSIESIIEEDSKFNNEIEKLITTFTLKNN